MAREFHLHVYFFQRNADSRAGAERIRAAVVDMVANREGVAVCHGVELAGVDPAEVPPVNEEPRGPHGVGSFEIWCPAEHLAKTLAVVMRARGGQSVLLHPLTRYELRDHTEDAMWLGAPAPLDLSALREDLGEPPAQYTALGLGYSAAAGVE